MSDDDRHRTPPLQLRREEPPKPTTWGFFKQFLKACGLLCYTSCPPIPERITRKLAFHPPHRGKTYQLRLLDGSSDKLFKKASKVHDKPFTIEIMDQPESLSEMQRQLFETTTFFTVETSHSVLVGMHSSPRKVPPPDRPYKQAIIFAQPNSSDLGWWSLPLCVNVPHLADIFECHMFAFDYSGFGCSTGSPSEMNINNDIAAIFDYVKKKLPDVEIVLMGYSIGTTCVIDLASKRPEGLTGVVLIAPFTSGLRLFQGPESVESGLPPTCCIRFDRFKSVDKISLIDVPTLICHGALDTTIPLAHGTALYAKLAHPVPMLIMHGADHSTIFTGCRWETSARILRFLRYETSTRDQSRRAFLSDFMQRLDRNKESVYDPRAIRATRDSEMGTEVDSNLETDGTMVEINLNTEPIE